jgi:hypothetical protein
LRFGVGAWPAIAAALTAHLLHLISTDAQTMAERRADAAPRTAFNPPYNQPASSPAVQLRTPGERSPQPVQPDPARPVYTAPADVNTAGSPDGPARPRDRARVAGRAYGQRHGHLPTVSELVELAHVARGTAAKALRDLKAERPALHLVNTTLERPTDQ